MPPAARLLDATAHPGLITGPGATTVLIEGLPAALAQASFHTCGFPGLPPHPPNPIVKGSATVRIAGMPAARMGDPCGCGAVIVRGAARTMIGG